GEGGGVSWQLLDAVQLGIGAFLEERPLAFLLPLQGEGRDGEGLAMDSKETHPHPNPPLEGEGFRAVTSVRVRRRRARSSSCRCGRAANRRWRAPPDPRSRPAGISPVSPAPHDPWSRRW